eukprot:TRINITY_DN2235_c0_g1_i1.p3 TRINITY_DN2235_c0_g1~~TRINITY_DN2235_c0_g1_i1.p3  ORF type:complete len:110 (-),score=26.25 TRINITY_DN2235_c0_g1_i1:55-384(-)
MRQRVEAETRAEVSKIEQLQKEAERESERRQAEIEDRMHAHHQKMLADSAFYAAEKAAAANKLLHSSTFVQLELAKSIANNTKIFFGADGLNGMFADILSGLAPQLKKA